MIARDNQHIQCRCGQVCFGAYSDSSFLEGTILVKEECSSVYEIYM